MPENVKRWCRERYSCQFRKNSQIHADVAFFGVYSVSDYTGTDAVVQFLGTVVEKQNAGNNQFCFSGGRSFESTGGRDATAKINYCGGTSVYTTHTHVCVLK